MQQKKHHFTAKEYWETIVSQRVSRNCSHLQTPNPESKPKDLNSQSQRPQPLTPKTSTLNPEDLNLQPQRPQPSTPQTSTLDPRHQIPNSKCLRNPSTLKPSTKINTCSARHTVLLSCSSLQLLDPKPSTLNPEP